MSGPNTFRVKLKYRRHYCHSLARIAYFLCCFCAFLQIFDIFSAIPSKKQPFFPPLPAVRSTPFGGNWLRLFRPVRRSPVWWRRMNHEGREGPKTRIPSFNIRYTMLVPFDKLRAGSERSRWIHYSTVDLPTSRF